MIIIDKEQFIGFIQGTLLPSADADEPHVVFREGTVVRLQAGDPPAGAFNQSSLRFPHEHRDVVSRAAAKLKAAQTHVQGPIYFTAPPDENGKTVGCIVSTGIAGQGANLVMVPGGAGPDSREQVIVLAEECRRKDQARPIAVAIVWKNQVIAV